jgi:hypothetical protein
MESSLPNRSALIVLVHGTWGRRIFPRLSSWLNAKIFKNRRPLWFEKNSSFRRDLSSALEDARLDAEFIAFEWSGSNSVFARSEAAKSLRDLLNQFGQNRPITIIAHSHGGNVALHAVGEGFTHADTTVVTLATPFLRVFPTWVGPSFLAYVLPTIIGYISLLLVLIPWFSTMLYGAERLHDIQRFSIDSLVVGLLACAPITWWLIYTVINPASAGSRKPSTWQHRPFHLAEAANYRIRPDLKLFVLRGANDEASLTLAAGKIAGKLSRIFRKGIVYLAYLFFAGPWGWLLGNWMSAHPKVDDFAFDLALTGGTLSFLLLYAPALFNTVFGREFLIGAARAEIVADSVPDAPHAFVKTLDPQFNYHSILQHYLYDHPECAYAIANLVWQTPPYVIRFAEPDEEELFHQNEIPKNWRSRLLIWLTPWIVYGSIFLVLSSVAHFYGIIPAITVVREDTVNATRASSAAPVRWIASKIGIDTQQYQLLGYDEPEFEGAACQNEVTQALLLYGRLRELLSKGQRHILFQPATCPCHSADLSCKYGRLQCAQILIDGEDISKILIREGFAFPYICDQTSCTKRRSWC